MSFVKEFGGTESSSATTLFASGTTTSGHLLVAVIQMYTGATVSVSSVTDDGGNTWLAWGWGPVYVPGHSCRGEIWYTFSTHANTTGVTANFSGSVGAVMSVQEHSGSWAYDTSTGQSTTGTAANSGTSSALAGSNDLIVAMAGDNGVITGGGTGYTTTHQWVSTGTGTDILSVYKYNGVSTGETYAATVPSGYWSCGLIAFKPNAPIAAVSLGALSVTAHPAASASVALGPLSVTASGNNAPLVTGTALVAFGALSVAATGPPIVLYNDIYRYSTALGASTAYRVATGVAVDGTWTDNSPASGVDYSYYAVAVGLFGSTQGPTAD